VAAVAAIAGALVLHRRHRRGTNGGAAKEAAPHPSEAVDRSRD
jgi:hypothetical protein